MSTISAGTTLTTALVQTGDTTGELVIKTNNGNTTAATFTTGGLFQFNSGYGSVATAYGCRAWVNFNGTGTVAIRASGNVSSITDNGTGDYTVNFTTAMPDADYCVTNGAGADTLTNTSAAGALRPRTYLMTSVRVVFGLGGGGTAAESPFANIAIFR